MIQIVRAQCPVCLLTSRAKDRYRCRQVVMALWTMQFGKCCYSEIPLPMDGQGKTVEHHYPKSKYFCKANEWSNLLLASPHCNGRKRNLFPQTYAPHSLSPARVLRYRTRSGRKSRKAGTACPLLIDPADPRDNPERHLSYVLDSTAGDAFGQIVARANSRKGRTTIDVTGLDDYYFLTERRFFVIEVLLESFKNIMRARFLGPEQSLRGHVDGFQAYLHSSHRFAGLAREFARQMKLDQVGVVIPTISARSVKTPRSPKTRPGRRKS